MQRTKLNDLGALLAKRHNTSRKPAGSVTTLLKRPQKQQKDLLKSWTPSKLTALFKKD